MYCKIIYPVYNCVANNSAIAVKPWLYIGFKFDIDYDNGSEDSFAKEKCLIFKARTPSFNFKTSHIDGKSFWTVEELKTT